MKNKLMKMKKLVLYCSIWCGNVAPAWAAANVREDNSNLFVWIFLGFCALIVIAQLIPVAMVIFGLAKGVQKKTTEVAPAVAETPVE